VQRGRTGLLKRVYRWPIDKLEEWSTGTLSPHSSRPYLRLRSIGCHPRQLSLLRTRICSRLPFSRQARPKGGVSLHRCVDVPSSEGQGEGQARGGRLLHCIVCSDCESIIVALQTADMQ
jgi:hypothetical protein